MNSWKPVWRVGLRELPFIAICTAAGWAIGVVLALTLMVLFFEPGDGYASFGVFFGLGGVLVGVLASRNLHASTRFSLAISMGQTRRGYLLWDTVWKGIECLLGILLSLALGAAEMLAYSALFPGEVDVLGMMSGLLGGDTVWLLLAGAAGLVVLNLVLTALLLRFGQKGFFVFFIPLWGFTFLINPAVQAAQVQSDSVLAGLGGLLLSLGASLSGAGWAVVLACIALAVMACIVAYLLRAPIRL